MMRDFGPLVAQLRQGLGYLLIHVLRPVGQAHVSHSPFLHLHLDHRYLYLAPHDVEIDDLRRGWPDYPQPHRGAFRSPDHRDHLADLHTADILAVHLFDDVPLLQADLLRRRAVQHPHYPDLVLHRLHCHPYAGEAAGELGVEYVQLFLAHEG